MSVADIFYLGEEMDRGGFDKEEAIRKMADLLRSGATMLAETCPICGSPLFRLKSGETVCPVHGRVYIISRDEEASRISSESVLSRLEHMASLRIDYLMRRMSQEDNPEIIDMISRWLDIILKIRAIRREQSR